MRQTWAEIAEFFRQKRNIGTDEFGSAMAAIEALAASIAEGRLNASLVGWISMHDLCIKQTDTSESNREPYLRLSPLQSGLVEFRYFDTYVTAQQWNRVVPPEGVAGRMTSFLDQLRWVARVSPAIDEAAR